MSCAQIVTDVALGPLNTFGIQAKAAEMAYIDSQEALASLIGRYPKKTASAFVLGGGSNLVLGADVKRLVLKMQIKGRLLVGETARHWIIEAGAGENWHDFVTWTLMQGYAGLENLALIPGTVGAAPVQNIGAYGLELQDRFDSLDYLDLTTGQKHTVGAAACQFAYRDSVFKRALAGRAAITQVRFALPRQWRREMGYADLQRYARQQRNSEPDAQTIYDWVCALRRAKLPDPQVLGNAGSFFKNPLITAHQCQKIIAREPHVVYYKLPDGSCKLAAASLIEACGWKGRGIGHVGVHSRHALVLVNHGQIRGMAATGGEVLTLAQAIQTSVRERFGVHLEIEPVVLQG